MQSTDTNVSLSVLKLTKTSASTFKKLEIFIYFFLFIEISLMQLERAPRSSLSGLHGHVQDHFKIRFFSHKMVVRNLPYGKHRYILLGNLIINLIQGPTSL